MGVRLLYMVLMWPQYQKINAKVGVRLMHGCDLYTGEYAVRSKSLCSINANKRCLFHSPFLLQGTKSSKGRFWMQMTWTSFILVWRRTSWTFMITSWQVTAWSENDQSVEYTGCFIFFCQCSSDVKQKIRLGTCSNEQKIENLSFRLHWFWILFGPSARHNHWSEEGQPQLEVWWETPDICFQHVRVIKPKKFDFSAITYRTNFANRTCR